MLKNTFSNSSSNKIDKKILGFLKDNLNPQDIFQKIRSSSDVEELSRFLYISGLHRTLMGFSVERLKKNKPVAWAYILKVFIKYKITPSTKVEKILFHHWLKNKENQSASLFACKEWCNVSPEFQQLYVVYIQDLEKQSISEEKELLDQLEFVQAQKLLKEEEEIIKKLFFIDPTSKKYKKLQRDLEEKKAILFIEEQKQSIDELNHQDHQKIFSEKEKKLKEEWFQSIVLMCEKDPTQTKNQALFLYFCGWPDKALDILERHIDKISDYWFYLEWAIETCQYTKGLELINQMFTKMENSADFFLPLVYLKSQILYALGKKTEAIEHLSSVSEVQPDYKSTQYFLDKWLKKYK